MFERWTDRARKAVILAEREARAMRHLEVGPEHLLLGLASEECAGVACKALAALLITDADLRDAVAFASPPGSVAPARLAEAETGLAAVLMHAVVSAAQLLRSALLAAAEYADPEGAEDE
jgi:ATP-dependent Clp protease ATP-binding subunit ClpC